MDHPASEPAVAAGGVSLAEERPSAAGIPSAGGAATPAAVSAGARPAEPAVDLRGRASDRRSEMAVQALLFLCAAVSVLTTAGIIFVLFDETVAFFRNPIFGGPIAALKRFLTDPVWSPLIAPQEFGVLPLVCGTALIAVGSAVIAVPLGLGSAIYLSEYAAARRRALLKPALEVLAGVPTVVYGFFALSFISPAVQWFFPSTQLQNAASAAIVVGVMILPTVASLSDDALRAVPLSLRQAGYALGATKFEVSTRIVLPGALSGVVASVILGIARAVGETMAVTLAAGQYPNLTLNPLERIQTMTGYIAQVSIGDTPEGTIEYQTIFAVGMLLFLITLAMNVIAHRVLKRFREVYE